MNTTHTKSTSLALSAILLSGCGLLDVQDDAEFDGSDDSTDTSNDTDTPPPPPTEGFRVWPQYMLQAVPAIVTIEEADGTGTPSACMLDGAPEGGYVCDAESLIGMDALIRVDRDGFDSALRVAAILTNQIQPLDVHLSVGGGPPGTWSACVAAGEFDSCAVVCETQMLGCVVTSCATDQPQWPLATVETFSSLECADLRESLASSCEEQLPLTPDVVSLRCCCSD